MGDSKAKYSVWTTVGTVLLIVDYRSHAELEEFRSALKLAGLNVNECYILCVLSDKQSKEGLRELNNVVYLQEKEITWWGRLKNEQVSRLISQKFDLGIEVGARSKKIKRLLKKCRVGFRLAINSTNNNYSVNLTTTLESPAHLINFAKNTLEKIH